MPDDQQPHDTLIDELDARQNDVLAQLEELNQRIEQLMAEFSRQSREPQPSPRERAA